ncbi:MAG: MazG-like family protein [bacterium]
MPSNGSEIDIARNLRIIQWLKAELLENISTLFKAMLRGSEEYMLEALAGLIITIYVLARRLGLSFARLEKKVVNLIQMSISEDHEVEKWYSDLSVLLEHFSASKR